MSWLVWGCFMLIAAIIVTMTNPGFWGAFGIGFTFSIIGMVVGDWVFPKKVKR